MLKKKATDIIKKATRRIPHRRSVQHVPKEKLSWVAPEFYYYPKNQYWIMGVGVLMLGIAFLIYAVAQYVHYELQASDYILIIALVLSIIAFGKYGHIEPEKLEITIDQKGITAGDKIYLYDQLKSFWIIEEPNPRVFFETVGLGWPVQILLEDQSVDEVYSFLLRYLPEHPTAMEHISDRLNHFLRF